MLRYGCNATAFQILNPGILLWFAPEGDAVVGYVTNGTFRVVAGAPICPRERMLAVMAAFEAEASQEGQAVCYFGVQERLITLLRAERGEVPTLLLGAQPVWTPQNWPGVVARKSSLRAQLARARNKHVRVGRWPAEAATNHPELARCLGEWLETRRAPPIHFLTEPNTLGYLEGRRVYVAERAGRVVGFLLASPVPVRSGWLIEQTIRGEGAPNGTTELLLDVAMRDIAASGYAYVTLGLAPLSRRAPIVPQQHPLWLRVFLHSVRAYGQRFYNFDGLDTFKARFLPETWEPIYAITSEPAISWRTIYAIAGAFIGGAPMPFLGRMVARALRQEARWFARRVGRRGWKIARYALPRQHKGQ